MQNIFDFIINNKVVVIFIFILFVCIIIGFFGNKRLESKKKKTSSDSHTTNKEVDNQFSEMVDTLSNDTNNKILLDNENINNSAITSNFYIPDDNDINNIF